MISNKKGIRWPGVLIYVVLSAALLVIILLFVVLFFGIKTESNISPEEVEFNLYSSRIINSEDCLAYSDSLGRIRIGLIDYQKFSESQIKSCLSEKTVKLELLSKNGNNIKTIDYLSGDSANRVFPVKLVRSTGISDSWLEVWIEK